MKLKSCFPVKDEKEIIFLILKTREKKKNSIVVNKWQPWMRAHSMEAKVMPFLWNLHDIRDKRILLEIPQ